LGEDNYQQKPSDVAQNVSVETQLGKTTLW